MSKKHCMFQFWAAEELPFLGYGTGKLVEDTDLITWEEAVELWQKHKPQAIRQLKDGENVEMCIWTGCDSTTDYHTDAFHIDKSTEIEGDNFIITTKKVIDPSRVAMGEPV